MIMMDVTCLPVPARFHVAISPSATEKSVQKWPKIPIPCPAFTLYYKNLSKMPVNQPVLPTRLYRRNTPITTP